MLKGFIALTLMLLALYLTCPVGKKDFIAPLSNKDKIILAQKISQGHLILSTLDRQPSDKLNLFCLIAEVKRNPKTGFPELALIYEAEDLNSEAETLVDDPETHDGHKARKASQNKHPAFSLVYGPYHTLPSGKYQACFRLKTSDCSTSQIIAKIDIAGQIGKTIFNQKKIRGNEFISDDKYQPFYLNFELDKSTPYMEYRVFFTDKADLWVDNIAVEPDFSALF